MTVSVSDLLKILDDTGLLSSVEVGRLRDGLAGETLDATQLTQELVRREKLTKYQAAALQQGKHRSLHFGDYVVLTKLGRGGMALVFKAKHRKTKQIAALKVLRGKQLDLVQRFQREIAATQALSHPNIVSALDFGGGKESGEPHFLVVEYIEGRDLQSVVERRGPLPVHQAVNYIVQAALGLAYAHRKGVIHRDIKPANLMVGRNGTLKVLDLGLARMDDALAMEGDGALQGLTQTGRIIGTIDYMSPEQAVDTKRVDSRTDIYSLGCTLFFAITGRTLFTGDTIVKRLLAHRQKPAPSLQKLRDDVPASLDDVFQKMVAKKRSERFQTMDEVVAALDAAFTDQAARHSKNEAAGEFDIGNDELDELLSDEFESADMQDSGSPPAVLSPSSARGIRRGPRLRFDQWTEKLQSLLPSLTVGGGILGGIGLVVGLIFLIAALIEPEPEPPPPPAPEPVATVRLREEMSVGPAGDFATFAEALQFVGERYRPAAHQWKTQTIRVPGGRTYNERIVIGNPRTAFPVGLRLVCDSAEPAALASADEGPLVDVRGVGQFSLEGFELQAGSRAVAVRIAGKQVEALFRRVTIHGFSEVGISMTGVGIAEGGLMFEQVTLASGGAGAVALRCRFTSDAAGPVDFAGCRFFGPLAGGIYFESPAADVRIHENVFDSVGTAIDLGGRDRVPRSIAIGNNTFRAVERGIVLAEPTPGRLQSLQVFRNLFVDIGTAEAVIERDGDGPASVAAFSKDWRHNWSSREPPEEPARGEIDLFADEGVRGLDELQFASLDRTAGDFLSPLVKLAEPIPDRPELRTKPYIGAVAPAPNAQPLKAPYELHVLRGHSSAIRDVVVACDALGVFTAGDDDTVRLWSTATGEALQVFRGHEGPVISIAVSPDAEFLVSGSLDETLRLWNVGTGEEVRRFEGCASPCRSLAWSRDGRFVVSGSDDALVRVWDPNSGDEIRRFEGHEGPVRCVDCSANGLFIASAGDDTVARIWSVQNGQAVVRLEGHGQPVNSVAFSSDGLSVITGGVDPTARSWNAVTGAELKKFDGHEDAVSSVAFSPNGRFVLTGSLDGTVRIWDAQSGEEVRRLPEHGKSVSSVTFSPDGQSVVSGGHDKTARIWDTGDLETAVAGKPLDCRPAGPTEITTSVGMKLALIPAGEFPMGAPETEEDATKSERRHQVRVTHSFYMGVYEVTQEEYDKVMGRNPSTFSGDGAGSARLPVENISWRDAAAFCEKLSALPAEEAAGRTYRLPTEAEWEYACRAGTTTVFWLGDSLSSDAANFDGHDPYGTTKVGPIHRKPVSVGSYRPNPFGLFDMHGNVHEWCVDLFVHDFYEDSPIENPRPRESATSLVGPSTRVIRGGGWSSRGTHCRSSRRGRESATRPAGNIGFRVVCE